MFNFSTTDMLSLVFNFAASVGIIFINKAIFATMKFRYTTILTALHYIITLAGLEVLAAFGVYQIRSSPTTPRLLLLSAVVGAAPALNNLSLSLNNLGFYQVVKLLVTPAIVALELQLYGQRMSSRRAVALVGICVGVGIAVINDVSISVPGLCAALTWVPIAALYKVLWSRESKENGWHVFALMRRVLPLSTLLLVVLSPLADPPGLLEFKWTLERAALIALSGVAAFFVNWSGFLVMGACSALTHTILGQLKAVVIILGGFVLFAHPYPPKAVAGAALAFGAIVWYTRENLREQHERKLVQRSSDADLSGAEAEDEDPLVLKEQAASGGRS